MNILACSDLHRDEHAAHRLVSESERADVIIVAGDLATKGRGAIAILDILKSASAPVVLVHGNHDVPDDLVGYCDDWKGGHYLHGTDVQIAGRTFFGLGGEIPSRNSHDWNAAVSEEEAAQLLISCPKDAVLITHTPPYGVADVQSDGNHEGSNAVADAIRSSSPSLLLCGHIHNAWGKFGHIGTTPVHNLGPSASWFQI